MEFDEQKRIQEHFERMHAEGITPWKEHPPEPLLIEFLELLAKEKPQAKILDIGCGDGWISIGLAKAGFLVWGIDSSKTAISRAKKAAEKEGLKSVEFRHGDALNLPYQDNFFDVLVDRGLFHHILPENRDIYFKNTLRVLKKDALFYLSVFSRQNPEGIGQRFTKEEITKLFGRHFNILKWSEDSWPTPAPAHLLHFILKTP